MLSGVSVMLLALLAVPEAQGAFFDMAGKSARIVGMSEVFLASSGDASGYWYNPAGLAHTGKRQVGVTYGIPAAIVSDLDISQVNFVAPLGEKSGYGVGISSMGISEAGEMVISGGYGFALTDRLSLGANAKLLRWSADGSPIEGGTGTDDDFSSTSFSVDLSAMYGLGNLLGLGDATTGVYVKNSLSPNISESGDDGGALPLEIGAGLMIRRGTITGEADIAFCDGNTALRAGAEYGLPESGLSARGGVIYGSDFESDLEQFDLNLGLGYDFGSLKFDYALVIPFEISNSGGKHFVSFGVSF